MHDSATPTTASTRPGTLQIARRSNWLLLLTRRRKKRSSSAIIQPDDARNEKQLDNETETTAVSSASSSSSSGRKSTFLYAFNKLMQIRHKRTTPAATAANAQLSSSHHNQDDNDSVVVVPANADSENPTAQNSGAATNNPVIFVQAVVEASVPSAAGGCNNIMASPPSSLPAAQVPTAAATSSSSNANIYCTSGDATTLLANQSTAKWLRSLSAAEATVYRARIAMTPMGWYRGAMTRERAQQKLQAQPNGSFLVRDSQTAGCHFTLSFRSAGITLHYRIECQNGFWVIESYRNVSLVGLIEHAQQLSLDQILCYVKPSSQLQQPFPVRLTHAISKRSEVPSLQHICRYVIRRHSLDDDDEIVAADDAAKTTTDRLAGCLPDRLKIYVRQNAFLGKHIGYFET